MTSLEVLTNDQRTQVHERRLHVLEHTGMRVDSDEGRGILREAGALVDEATRIVRFPPSWWNTLSGRPRDASPSGAADQAAVCR